MYDSAVEAGIRLLADAPWGAAAVEEGHASTSMMLRKHAYEERTLRTRAVVAQARPLFAKHRLQKKSGVLRARIARLRRKQPHQAKGRHMCIKSMLDLGARRRRDGIYTDRHVGQKIVRAANKVWLDAPAAVKQRYDAERAKHCKKKRQPIAASISKLAASLQVLAERAEETKASEGPLRMSSCCFSISELRKLDESWQAQSRIASGVYDYEDQQCQLVNEPDEIVKLELDKYVPLPAPANPRQWWVAPLCLRRESFSHSALRWKHAGAEKLGILLFAAQKRYLLAFLAVRLVASRSSSGSSSSSDVFPNDAKHLFRVSIGIPRQRWRS